jgi:hypothetical protein
MNPPDMYYGMDWNPGYDGVFDDQHILVSAGVTWYSTNREWFDTMTLPDDYDGLFVDSGGFQATARWNLSYPYTVGMYFNHAEQLGADYVAGPDYACEPGLHHSSTGERVLKTAAAHREAKRVYDEGEWSFEFVPVLQGWDVKDYRKCIRLYRDFDLLEDYMALGTVCKRDNTDEIHDVLRMCERELPDTDWHMFGLTKRAWRELRFWGRFESADTAAWNWGGCTTDEKMELGREYIRGIESIRERIRTQSDLHEYDRCVVADGGGSDE